jgi:central kinetochore subunit Mal2/MCM21
MERWRPRSQVGCSLVGTVSFRSAAVTHKAQNILVRHVSTRQLWGSTRDLQSTALPTDTITQDFDHLIMATIQDLDADINDLHARIATLQAHRSNLASVLLSQPHLSARLQTPNHKSKSSSAAQRAVERQSKRNLENIYRACAGVTAYKLKDPDPNAINNGNILGVSIDVSIGGKFIETYHVLLNWRERIGNRLLKIHKHTIPPCIPLQHLANKWLPTSWKDAEIDPEQDLVRFGRLLRKELVSWHMRVKAVDDLKQEAGISSLKPRDANDGEVANAGQTLNAFVSDDEASSDVEEDGIEDGPVRILDIENDAAVREITITWSDRRVAVMTVTKDGRIEKASCRARDGGRDISMSTKAIGPIGGLIRRLKQPMSDRGVQQK